jgi:alpha-L-fucosidase
MLTALLFAAMATVTPSDNPQMIETKSQRDARMNWWREARFGMFIHWGLYAIPAGEWGNRKNHGEWIMETAQIPVDTYEKFVPQFNPVKFDASKWARMAKGAGMKYVVITSKHHDGFALFDSKVSEYDVMATPFKRDIMRELSEAVRGEGLTMCWYHSIMDWHHPAYVPARKWNPRQDPNRKNLDEYVPYLRSQVTELLTKYGPIGVMWFDGEWESTWNDTYGRPLYELCRTLQPSVIVNNRVSNSRGGSMASGGNDQRVGDFSTPEQFIPPTGLKGVDWETCMTMNDNWGWNKNDKDWKSSEQLIRNLVDIVSKGGNYLLNIGPTADGTFPPEAVQRLKEIGRWMKANGDSIYGTTASVFEGLSWGRSTTKAKGKDTILYLHVFDWPKNKRLVVPGVGNTAIGANLVGQPGGMQVDRSGSDLVIHVPLEAPDKIASVIELEIEGAPIIYKAPVIVAASDILVDSVPVTFENPSKGLSIRYTFDGTDPSIGSELYKGSLKITESGQLRAATFHNGRRVSPVSAMKFTKVRPKPGSQIPDTKEGVLVREFKGNWDKAPDFSRLAPSREFTSSTIMLGPGVGEYVGRSFAGFIEVAKDGVYVFDLTSDDGSQLLIGDEVVVDNDGLHGSVTKSGRIALGKGKHRIVVNWFNKSGDLSLDVRWAKVGDKMKPLMGLRH